jgi:replicative DNA helicase
MASSVDLQPDELVDGWERALLGGLLWAPEHPLPPLLAQEFFLERHRILWGAMQELLEAGQDHGLTAVTEHLRQAGTLEAAGGVSGLMAVFDEGTWAVPPLLTGYAERVRAGATSRALRGLGQELAATGMSAMEIQRRLDALPTSVSLTSPRDRWREVQARWGKAGLQMGLPEVDRMTGGLFPGDLIVIGGRPSHGKTALLVSIALHAGVQEGLGVAYLTLEMSAAAVFRRFLGARARLRLVALRSGALGASEFELADQTADWLARQPITILDAADLGGKSADRLLLAAGAAEAPVVMIDHLQEVVTRDGESRAYELGRFLGALKDVAIRRGKVIFLAAQLLRQADERRGPALGDLKESGGTEEKADVVLLLDYPIKRRAKDRQGREFGPEDLLVYVAKNRDGGTGRAVVRILAQYGLVLPLARESGGEPDWVRSDGP